MDDPILTLGLDAADLEASVLNLLNTPDGTEAILSLEGKAARAFLDILQKFADGAVPLLVLLSLKCLRRLSERSVSGGGCADIWRGTHHGKPVALKVLRVFTTDNVLPKLHKEFCKEALVWRQLKHPNVAPFIGVETDLFPPHMCMVSPWMSNGNILQYLINNPKQDRTQMMCGIAEGINYLHSMNPAFVHGDIRGANILINEELRPVLTDFGLAVVSDSQAATYGTVSLVKGSVRWMAPELFDPTMFQGGKSRRSPQTDVYAFACLGIELYSGRPPFPDVPEATVLMSVMQGKRPELATQMPYQIWDLLQRCWTHQPSQRPRMDRVARVLENMCKQPILLHHSVVKSRFLPSRLGPLPGESWVRCMAIAVGCKLVALGSSDGSLRVWDAETDKSWQLEGYSNCYSIAFSPDSRYLASGSHGEQGICIWDVETWTSRKLTAAGRGFVAHAIVFSPDGRRIASDYDGVTVCVWDLKTGASNVLKGKPGPTCAIAFSPDSKQIASSTGQTIHIWDAETCLWRSFPAHAGWIRCIAWSPDGRSIACGSARNIVRVWDVGGRTFETFTGHTRDTICLAFSTDSKRVVSGSTDQTVCVWDAKTCALISGPFKGDDGKVLCVTFSPDGRHVFSASQNSATVRAWAV